MLEVPQVQFDRFESAGCAQMALIGVPALFHDPQLLMPYCRIRCWQAASWSIRPEFPCPMPY